MNDKQNINAQEAKLTEEVKNVSQQHESQQQKILKIEIKSSRRGQGTKLRRI